jgi:hypothetical protein
MRPDGTWQRFATPLRALAIVALMLSVLVTPGAGAEGAEGTVPAAAEPAPAATEVAAETPPPDPAPAPPPAVEPAPVKEPAPDPAPVVEQPAPAVEPADPPVVPADEPVVEPTDPPAIPTMETEDPAPAREASDAPATQTTAMPDKGLVAPAAATAEKPAMTGACSPTNAGVIGAGQMASFTCSFSDGPVKVRLTSQITPGWRFSVNAMTEASFGTSAPVGTFGSANAAGSIAVYLRPTGTLTPGTVGELPIRIARNGDDSAYTTTLTATLRPIPDPTAADLSMTCTSSEEEIAWRHDSTYSCELSSIAAKPARITRVTITSPAGWSVGSGVDPRTLVIQPVVEVTPGAPYTFSFAVTRAACEAAAGDLAVASSYTFDGNQQGPHEGPATTIAITPTAPWAPAIQAQAVDFGVLTWTGATWPIASQMLSITLSRSDCGGSAYDLNLSIPVAEATGYLDPVAAGPSSQGAGIIAQGEASISAGASGSLATIAPAFAGAGTVTVPLSISPTNEVPPGEHSFTIEIWTTIAQ